MSWIDELKNNLELGKFELVLNNTDGYGKEVHNFENGVLSSRFYNAEGEFQHGVEDAVFVKVHGTIGPVPRENAGNCGMSTDCDEIMPLNEQTLYDYCDHWSDSCTITINGKEYTPEV